MAKSDLDNSDMQEIWRVFLTEGETPFRRSRRLFRVLPASPRCKLCFSPFKGAGGFVMGRLMDKRPSRLNPQFCDVCFRRVEKNSIGVEISLSLLFADIRGSTHLAETLGTKQFSDLIARFYNVVTSELIKADALIDRLIGDEVIALFVPGLAGKEHAEKAMKAAKGILEATGHGKSEGPWAPLGIGVHTGTAFVGSVGSAGVSDITALGDDVNLTARLASTAKAGEILITESARAAAGLATAGLEPLTLDVKGRSAPVDAWLMAIGTRVRE